MTLSEIALSWSWEPLTLFSLGLLAFFYTRGLRLIQHKKIQIMIWWRPLLFYTGLTIILLTLISPLDTLGSQLFVFHMTQHMLLTHVGVPLLLLGAPVLPVLRGMPYGLRQTTVGALSRFQPSRQLSHLVTHPLVSSALFIGAYWAWHLPAAYSMAVTNDLIHIAQHSTFLSTSVLFWWVVIDPVPMIGRAPYFGRLAYVILALSLSIPLAALLTFAQEPWYSVYAINSSLWKITPFVDQQLGGLVMWIGGMVPYFIAMAALFVVALNKDEEATRRTEALAAAEVGS